MIRAKMSTQEFAHAKRAWRRDGYRRSDAEIAPRAEREARAILAETEPALDMHFGWLTLDGKRGSYADPERVFRGILAESLAAFCAS
jgi:hypothetical protein